MPELVKRCPEDREVPLEELGVNPKTRLLVLNPKPDGRTDPNLGFWTISPANTEPELISNTIVLEGYQNNSPRLTSNGNWLAYDYYRLYQDETYIMVSHINGTEQRTFGPYYIGPYHHKDVLWFQWLSDQVLVSYTYTSDEDELPRIVIHPFTGEVQTLPYREELVQKTTYITTYLSKEDEVYILYYSDYYLAPDPGFVLYNMNTGTSIPVLDWVEKEEWLRRLHLAPWNPWNLWFGNDNLVNVVVYKEYGFDIATSMSLDFISQPKTYWEVMQPIRLPMEVPDLSNPYEGLQKWWGAKTKPFFLFSSPNLEKNFSYFLYGFDYSQMTLIDYCFENRDVPYTIVSPDERFIAWNVYDENLPYKVKEVVILSLETGKIAKISTGVEIWGWGEVP